MQIKRVVVKATVLVIGQNVERQIIDLGQKDIVYDENHRAWLDIRFDNRALAARSSKRLFSQLGLLKRTLGLLDYRVVMSDRARNFAMRVVLKSGDSYKVVRAGLYDDYLWERPEIAPKVIVILESAILSEAVLDSINRYLVEFPHVKLVVEYRNDLRRSVAGQRLLKRANLVWADLISYQTGETENILNQFQFDKQILLVNHRSGLSLSDKFRTYKLTNADYLELKSLEWLAIAIKVIGYDFDIEDKLELIARIGQSIVRSNQVNIGKTISQISHRSPEIELIRGEPNMAKLILNQARQINGTGHLVLDLSHQSLEHVQNILAVRDLPTRGGTAILSEKHFLELQRQQPEVLESVKGQIAIGYHLPVRIRVLGGCGREVVSHVEDLDQKLNQAQYHKVATLKMSAEFLFGQSTPTDRIILTNVRELAEFAAKTLTRAIVPIIEIKGSAQVNFDGRPGAVALEYLRILRGLEVELRARHVDLNQVVVWMQLPVLQGKMLDAQQAKLWIQMITEQIKEYNLKLNRYSFVAAVPLSDFKQLKAAGANVVCCAHTNLAALTQIPMTADRFRIRFSQFLAEV